MLTEEQYKTKRVIEALTWLKAVDTLIGSNVPDLICWEYRDQLLELRACVQGLKFRIEEDPTLQIRQ